MLLWPIYIVIHTIFIAHGEHYKIYLILGYFCFFLLIYELFSLKVINRNALMYIFFFWGIIESILCLLQFGGFVDSQNKYFDVTGSFENPNITAMFITAVLPFGIFRIVQNNKVWGCLLTGILCIALVLLKCRTAYIGLLIIIAIFLIYNNNVRRILSGISIKYKVVLLVLILTGALFAGNFLYNYKGNSVDGRILIWKLSARMITDKPLTGYGYGLFEKNYNLYQASYFMSGNGDEIEKVNANHIYMAYNEYIEQCIEGGIIGLIFYLLVLGYSVWKSINQKSREAFTITIAIAAMGCCNFIVQAIPVWLVFLVYLASLSDHKKTFPLKKYSLTFSILFSITSIGLLSNQLKLFNAQHSLKQALILSKEKRNDKSFQLFKQYIDNAETSEAYLRNYGKALIFNKEYLEAINILEDAACYTSTPDVFYSLAKCYIQTKQYEKAETALNTVMYMIPLNLKSRYQLMWMYNILNQKEKAEEKAMEIIAINPKKTTRESHFYKNSAKEIIRNRTERKQNKPCISSIYRAFSVFL